MRMVRMSALIGLVGLLVITACQTDQKGTEPVEPIGPSLNSSASSCPSAVKLLVQIATIVKPGQGRLATAIIKFDQIVIALVRRDTAKAQQRMFELLDFLVTEYNNGNLIGGKSTATQTKLTALTAGLYCFVGLPVPVIPAGALGPDGAIGVVNSSTTTTLVNSTMQAGIQVPQNAANGALVTISRRPNSPPPLLTLLDQYPAFYDYNVSPEGPFAEDVIIGVCVGDAAPTAIFGRLKIAHNVGTGVEILEQVTLPFSLDCSNLLGLGRGTPGLLGLALRGLGTVQEGILPQMAQATTVGQCCVGGSTKKFSPFGAVDPVVFATAVSPIKVYGLPNSSVPTGDLPRVRVKTLNGTAIPGLTVTFSIPGASEGSITGTVKTTDSNGEAALDSWTLGPTVRLDSVLATVTPIPGTMVNGSPVAFEAQVIAPPFDWSATGWTWKSVATWSGSYPSNSTITSAAASAAGYSGPVQAAFSKVPPLDNASCSAYGSLASRIHSSVFGENTIVAFRRDFTMPGGATSGTMSFAIDNDFRVFVNGVEKTSSVVFASGASGTSDGPAYGWMTHGNCPARGDFTLSLTGLSATGNTVVVVGLDRGGSTYFDASVVGE